MTFTGLLPQPPYPWLGHVWQGFVARVEQNRLPHALLIIGQGGLGCAELAKAMAQYLLCNSPKPNMSCGQCKSCLLMQAESHPDLYWVQPEEGAQSIKISQIREMTEFTVNTAQQGGRKLIILNPAEAMNANAANALLKSLEEPTGDSVYLLVSEQPAFLMATIRSRCSRIIVGAPDRSTALTWLERNRVTDAGQLLDDSGGRPLRVMEWLANDLWGQRKQLGEELSKLLLGQSSFLDSAKSALNFGPLWVVEQIQWWLVQAIRQQLSRPANDPLVDELCCATATNLHQLYENVARKKALLLSSANPNPQMLLDEIMMEIKDLLRKND